MFVGSVAFVHRDQVKTRKKGNDGKIIQMEANRSEGLHVNIRSLVLFGRKAAVTQKNLEGNESSVVQ